MPLVSFSAPLWNLTAYMRHIRRIYAVRRYIRGTILHVPVNLIIYNYIQVKPLQLHFL